MKASWVLALLIPHASAWSAGVLPAASCRACPSATPMLGARCAPARSIKMNVAEEEEPADITPASGAGAGGGGLATVGATFEQLLGSLPAKEKYNAVLLSLVSGESSADPSAALDLVSEMTSKRIVLSKDALKALLDSAVNAGEPAAILDSLRASRANGACRAFGTPQLQLPDRPSAAALEALPPLPADSRGVEVGAAAAFAVGIGGVLALELVDFVDFTDGLVSAPPLPLVLAVLAAGWGTDRYVRQGELAALIGRGLARLFSRDLQRECALESSSFLLGYLLGLPCCPFAPTVFKPLDMLQGTGDGLEAELGSPARLVDRVLIWLMAPAALEIMSYKELLQADATLGRQFLSAARRREASLGVDVTQGGWGAAAAAADGAGGGGEAAIDAADEQRVRWAYGEARRLLTRYSGVREVLQQQMASGVSAGDCVVLIEDRLKNQWAAI